MVAHFGHPRHAHFNHPRRYHSYDYHTGQPSCNDTCMRIIYGILGTIFGCFILFWLLGAWLQHRQNLARMAENDRMREQFHPMPWPLPRRQRRTVPERLFIV